MQRNVDMNTNDLLYNYLHCTVVLFTIYNTIHNYIHPDTHKNALFILKIPQVWSVYKRTKIKVTIIYILKILGINNTYQNVLSKISGVLSKSQILQYKYIQKLKEKIKTCACIYTLLCPWF
jgi:hypothetical protein